MEDAFCLKKRKREEEARQLEQTHAVCLPEAPRPQSIDLSRPGHGFPLPPGWEQCLDLQSGEMYFLNSATRTRIAMASSSDLEMKLPPSAARLGISGNGLQEKLQENGMAHQVGDVGLTSSLNLNGLARNLDMAATVCLHCRTFVIVSRCSPHCPSCRNVCIE